jgi:hypothetical protein
LIVVAAAVVSIGATLATLDPSQTPASTSEDKAQQGEASLRIVAVSFGRWSDLSQLMWFLSVEEDGRIHLDPERPGRPMTPIGTDGLARLRRIVEDERFLELQDRYGGCTDCPQCWLTVKLGSKTKRVGLSQVGREGLSVSGRQEMDRALRVWKSVKEVAGVSDVEDGCQAPSKG